MTTTNGTLTATTTAQSYNLQQPYTDFIIENKGTETIYLTVTLNKDTVTTNDFPLEAKRLVSFTGTPAQFINYIASATTATVYFIAVR